MRHSGGKNQRVNITHSRFWSDRGDDDPSSRVLFGQNTNTTGTQQGEEYCARVHASEGGSSDSSPPRLFADLSLSCARLTHFGLVRLFRNIELASSKHSPVKSSMLRSSDLLNSNPLSECRSARVSADRAGLAVPPPTPPTPPLQSSSSSTPRTRRPDNVAR
uniref:Uncharacterized protein n=1 Tax=Schizaphis graminum TaxID=13262 RepID=A0A2S2PGE7_SCHGA